MGRWMFPSALALALLCAGCGTATPPPVEESPLEAGVSVETDYVLSTLETTVENGRVLRVEALGRRLSDYEQYGVGALRIYEGDTLLQTLSIQEAIDTDGVSGLIEGYTDCWLPDGGVTALDMNFDGTKDLGLFAWIPAAGNLPYYYWLWNADAGEFQYAYCLCNAVPNAETEQITSETHSGATYYTDYYTYTPHGALELTRQEVQTYGMTQDTPVTTVYQRVDGEMVLAE